VPFNTFVIFYAMKNLGESRGDFGKVLAWGGTVTLPLFLVLGPIVDRFHPLRVVLTGFVTMCIAGAFSFVFMHDGHSFLIVMITFMVAQGVYAGGNASLLPRLLPRERYGQFCSANAMINATAMVVAPYLCGVLLDVTKDYRWVFLWASVWAGAGALITYIVLRHWKALGGDAFYIPPTTGPAPEEVNPSTPLPEAEVVG
jgi:MFS-type transporter involved in bile tolerance (Atg22 family)